MTDLDTEVWTVMYAAHADIEAGLRALVADRQGDAVELLRRAMSVLNTYLEKTPNF